MDDIIRKLFPNKVDEEVKEEKPVEFPTELKEISLEEMQRREIERINRDIEEERRFSE